MAELKIHLTNDQIIGSIEDNDEKMTLTKDLIRGTERQIDKCEIAYFAIGEMCRCEKRKLLHIEKIIQELKIAIENETADLLNHIGGYLNAPAIEININGILHHIILRTGNMECNRNKVFYCFATDETPGFYSICDLRIEECMDILGIIRYAVNQPKNIQEYGEYRYKN